MKRLVLFILILIACSAVAQQNFSSKDYNFRISFPKDWDISTKNYKYVVEAYEDDYTGVTISATRYQILPDSMDISYIQKDSLKKIVEEQFKYQYKKASVISSGTGQIDGILAYYYFVQYSDYKDGMQVKYISFQYQFVYKKLFYSMFGICPAKQYEEYEKIFNKIYSTFRFINKK
jgi:hypothetical protein